MNQRNSLVQKTKWLGLLICLFCFGNAAVSVWAHAALVRSDPIAGAVLTVAPTAVVLEFTETLDAGATAVNLLDAQSQIVVPGPGLIDPDQPTILRLPLPPLADGAYSIAWQARSTVDGHITEGTVPFAIGADAEVGSTLPAPGNVLTATQWPRPDDAILRWLNYVAASLTVGSLLFAWLVWRPAFRQWADAQPESDKALAQLLKRLIVVGGISWMAVTLLFVLSQAAGLTAESFAKAVGVIVVGRTGQLAMMRLLLILAVLVTVRWLAAPGHGRLLPWWIASALGGAALMSISLQSHSAALAGSPTLPILSDWLHLLAMAAWLGGLPPLLWLIWQHRSHSDLLKWLIPAFSKVALLAVLVLGVTGLYSAQIHVQTAEALTNSTHGRALAVKLGLFGLLLLLGAVNLLIFSPRLRRGSADVARGFGYTVRAELLLGTAVLLAVGVMTGVAPAFEALQMQNRLGIVQGTAVDDVEMLLVVSPGHAGVNEIAVDIDDKRPGTDQQPAQVFFRLQHGQTAESQVETSSQDQVRFYARGSHLSAVGTWQLEVIVRRAGFDDVRHMFQVEIVSAAAHNH